MRTEDIGDHCAMKYGQKGRWDDGGALITTHC